MGLQIKRRIKILALWPPGSSLYRDKNKKLILKSQEIGSLLNLFIFSVKNADIALLAVNGRCYWLSLLFKAMIDNWLPRTRRFSVVHKLWGGLH